MKSLSLCFDAASTSHMSSCNNHDCWHTYVCLYLHCSMSTRAPPIRIQNKRTIKDNVRYTHSHPSYQISSLSLKATHVCQNLAFMFMKLTIQKSSEIAFKALRWIDSCVHLLVAQKCDRQTQPSYRLAFFRLWWSIWNNRLPIIKTKQFHTSQLETASRHILLSKKVQ